jgi:hypothetical protein
VHRTHAVESALVDDGRAVAPNGVEEHGHSAMLADQATEMCSSSLEHRNAVNDMSQT